MARTLYDVLMVSPLADRQVVTVVYRHLAKRYHPDIDPSPEAAARMAELNDAYAVLGDPARRDAYDEEHGLPGPHARSSGGPGRRDANAPARPSSRPTGPHAGSEQASPRPGDSSAPAGESSPDPPGSAPRASGPAGRPSDIAAGQAGGPSFGDAGPPPVNPPPVGPTLTFGRYRGWSLNQVARYDRDYLEWLSRTTMGRTYRRELDALLRRP